MVKTCLIISSKSDIHVDAVIKELLNFDIAPVRLNIETFAINSSYVYEFDDEGSLTEQSLRLLDSNKSLGEASVIWWRKFGEFDRFKISPDITDTNSIQYCQKEADAFIHSLPGLYPEAAWVNTWDSIHYSSYKLNQILVAKKLGIKIPKTIISNSYKKIVNFMDRQDGCIIKPITQHSGFSIDGENYRLYTREITRGVLEENKDSIKFSPILVQEKVIKKHEYRVTIIGNCCFVCQINSQLIDDREARIDWRLVDPDNVQHVVSDLPEKYKSKLKLMLKELKLNFGAFDIVEDIYGELFFLELNPNGQWYWIEILTGLPMAKEMASLIKNLA
jgi:glutathione synthase/RimK-type ligase-like ATP-grasp enzyme